MAISFETPTIQPPTAEEANGDLQLNTTQPENLTIGPTTGGTPSLTTTGGTPSLTTASTLRIRSRSAGSILAQRVSTK
jgi:hypothetical protein